MKRKKLPQKFNYNKKNDEEKKEFLKQYHCDNNYSINELADFVGTYPNKLFRDMKRFGMQNRNRSEAQIAALKAGNSKHPTEGRERTEEEKAKIGETKYKQWKSTPEEVKEEIRQKHREIYRNRDEKPHEAPSRILEIKKAAKIGSKLELFLVDKFSDEGYDCVHHQEHTLENDSFHIDLFLTRERIAIEVDGPSHYEDVWKDGSLARVQEKDARKNKLIYQAGMYCIRVLNDRKFTPSFGNDIFNEILRVVEKIKKGKVNKKTIIKCKV